MKMVKAVSFFLVLFILTFTLTNAQDDAPRLSPKASVSQVIGGYTNVTVIYSRPGVKDRIIWDNLVPYNEVWRTGANEATTIEFERDIELNGNKIPKGKYGLFTIPGKDEWTIIINKVWDQWGAFNYNADEDLVRFKVKPEKSDFTERLLFIFDYVSPYSAHLIFEWENVEVPVLIKATEKQNDN